MFYWKASYCCINTFLNRTSLFRVNLDGEVGGTDDN